MESVLREDGSPKWKGFLQEVGCKPAVKVRELWMVRVETGESTDENQS